MVARSRQPKPFAKPLVGSAAVAILFAGLYLLMLSRLVNLGQSKAFYLIALVPLAASAAACLFLAGGSVAAYVGDAWGGRLKLGGPPVVFFGVIILGLAIPEARAFAQTVRLKQPAGRAVPLTGNVVLALPTGDAAAVVGPHGTAVFSGIPREFARQAVSVGLEVKGYRLSQPGQTYTLGETQVIEVPIEPDVVALVVRGHVLSAADQKPIEGASVTIGADTVLTDAHGWFEVTLPPAAEARTLSARVLRDGYQPAQLDVPAVRRDESGVPVATILLSPT